MRHQQIREAIVRAHLDAEARHDWEATTATFRQPRYEIEPTREVHDGEVAVRRFFRELHTAFPDLGVEVQAFHHAEDSVLVEVIFTGTHLGIWHGLPPTGRAVRYRMNNRFVFDADELICERVHFDIRNVLHQLGVELGFAFSGILAPHSG